ncbi:ADP-ribosylglycohydrolase family protein [Streptomyces sp. PBH53]|uniref:ADP-ribosylglycohydrolase family protein n=1 Tax=Streptomyces sp. PBH53 TaxID=1577075 RepID=UPI000A68826C|nr:ADP-ribosylglycohydrolase family protein [Streptomyces sp. PBH53]
MASIACTPPVPAPEDAAGLRERARGALLGLAVGDALGAPAENLKPSEIRARWGRITGYVAEQPCGTDDTEYAIFSGLLLARHGSALTPADAEAAWHEWIADRAEGPFRGAGFSERGTLENLRRGLAAPISAQHRHAWSDGLAMRAAPFGVFAAGRPAEAARLVAVDGSVSHEGEGIYGGQAVAAGVAAAMTGATVPVVIAAALAVVPDDSWTARSLRRAVAVAHRGERAVRSAVVIGGYPWTDLAPEAVALAFGAYAAADGDFREAVLTAVNMGRDADTTAAVAGALSGATRGLAAIPPAWASAIGPARGRCLPSMAGHHVLEVADLLVAAAEANSGEAGQVEVEVEVARAVVTAGAPPRGALPDGEPPRGALPGPVPDRERQATRSGQTEEIPATVTAGAPPRGALPGPVPDRERQATRSGQTAEIPATVTAGAPPRGALPGPVPDGERQATGTGQTEEIPATVTAGAPPRGALPDGEPRAGGAGQTPLPPPPPASQPTESGGGWAGNRGSRGRSPLVGAGNAGQLDSEGRS